MDGFIFGNTKPKKIGDALLEQYISAVGAFVKDRTLLFMLPHFDNDLSAYLSNFTGYDPADKADAPPPPPIVELVTAPADYEHPRYDPVWEIGDRVVDALFDYGVGTITEIEAAYYDREGTRHNRREYVVQWDRPSSVAMRFGYQLTPAFMYKIGDRVLDLTSSIGNGRVHDVKSIPVIRDDQPRLIPSYMVMFDAGELLHRFEYCIEGVQSE